MLPKIETLTHDDIVKEAVFLMNLPRGEALIQELRKRIAELEAAKENAVQQAQIWSMEARTASGQLRELLERFGLPNESCSAVPLITAHVARLEAERDKITDRAISLLTTSYCEKHRDSITLDQIEAEPCLQCVLAEREWHDLRENPEDLPPDNRLVEVWVENSHKKKRYPLTGCYVREKQLEAEDSEFGEYDEDSDCYWCPAGWYESVANDYCEYGYVRCNSGHVVGWRLITPPQGEEG